LVICAADDCGQFFAQNSTMAIFINCVMGILGDDLSLILKRADMISELICEAGQKYDIRTP
jgi:hypothetical protein